MSILVVEQEPLVRGVMLATAEDTGLEAVPAADAAEAKQRLKEQTYELAVCDVTARDGSGLELCRYIAARYPGTALAIVGSAGDRAAARVALDLAAYGYLTKPFGPGDLAVAMSNALRRRSLEIENRAHRERLEHLLDQRTAALKRREVSQRALAYLGQRALSGMDLPALFAAALDIARDQLQAELASILELSADRSKLVVVGCSGGPPGTEGKAFPVSKAQGTGLAITTELPVRAGRKRWPKPTPIGGRSTRVSSALNVVIRSSEGPYGVLCAQCRTEREFSDEDVSFLQSVANLVGHALSRQHYEERLRDQALRDPLTSLPNRAVLTDRLDYALLRAGRNGGTVAVLFIDLDHFKNVNDSLGHTEGDRLLVAVADRLTPYVRSGDTLARFGGDEFIVLCDQLGSPSAAITIASRLLEALEQPFVLGSDTVFVTASIGIAVANDPTAGAEVLIRDADTAVYLAKEKGRARVEFFDAALRNRAVDRMRTETSLRFALDRHELVAYYQPVIDLRGHNLAGLEALARWHHRERGLLLPGTFIPISEETGLIQQLGSDVLHQACRQLAAWTSEGVVTPDVWVSVNMSARQLANPDCPDVVHDALSGTGIDPARLWLEITESSLLDGTVRTLQTMTALHDLGVHLVLDDFGTGYSSPGYIQRYQLDGLKLDRSFVADLGQDRTQRAVVGGIISIAQALGLETIAEGIETQSQADAARDLGCHLGQGFLFGAPEEPETTLGKIGAV